MKIPMLAAALTLAALAAPASAQLDMSAARRSLDAIKALKVQAAAQKKAPSRAPAVLPSADDADWAKIIEQLKSKGKYEAEEPPLKPGMFTLEDAVGDAKADHQAFKVRAVGMINDDELFEVIAVLLSGEDWKMGADGNWRMDTWVFEADVYGTVQSAVHIAAVVTPDLKPVSGGPEKISPSDPRIPAKYKSVIDHWAAKKP
ncbi:MAG: hypothetical protein HY079_12095 [Elusimicrobia bacterium]|nr:hypothetical protein [Elusimicrobiota bacterium]